MGSRTAFTRGLRPLGLQLAREWGHLPEHYHPSFEERWETLEGSARVKLDRTWRDLVPADRPILVARNVRHELKNESGRLARMRTRVTPTWIAEFALRFREETVMTSPPPAVQRLVLPLLARFARRS
jgi:hypothetical protein